MSLETGTYLADLNTANPAGTDPKAQGDDHIRLLKSVLKNSFAGFAGAVVVTGAEAEGASANAFEVTVSPAPAAYSASMMVVFKATHANTGAATLKINALAAKALKAVDGGALEAADIESGALCAAFYDGTDFLLISGNDRAARGGETYSGAHDFTGATARVATVSSGDNSTKAASTAYVDAADALKAPLVSPALTGTPTAPTAAPGTNTTQVATTAFATQLAFQAALPVQTGAGGKFLTTDGTNASWASIKNLVLAKSGNFTVAATERYSLFDCTGTITASLVAAATAGDGFIAHFRNSGTGAVTLDPNSSETVTTPDGTARATTKLYPGEVGSLICDGSGWRILRAGGEVLIQKQTVSGAVATVDFEIGLDDAEFARFILFCDGLSADGGAPQPMLRFKKSGAYAVTGYATTDAVGTASATTTYGQLAAANGAAGTLFAFRCECLSMSSAVANGQTVLFQTGATVAALGYTGNISQSTAAAVTGLRVLFTSDNVNAGTLRLYGVR